MKKKRKSPSAPFVVTVATLAVAALVPACGSVVTEDPPQNPPAPDTCPVEPPAAGSGCSGDLSCTYGQDICDEVTYQCLEGVWADFPTFCNPPPPGDCPDVVPGHGEWCQEFQLTCQYPDACGGTITATCTSGEGDLEWFVTSDAPPCNPPACPPDVPEPQTGCDIPDQVCVYEKDVGCGPQSFSAQCKGSVWQVESDSTCVSNPDACAQHLAADACAADPQCRWLVPGWDQTPLAQTGCHLKQDCGVGSECPPDRSCLAKSVNPCWNSDCDACSEVVHLCLIP